MQRLARFLTNRVMAMFEGHVAEAVSFVTEALSFAREQALGLDDIDREVLLERIQTTSFLLGNLLRLLHDELDDLDDVQAIAAVTEIAGRRRKAFAIGDWGRSEYLLALLSGAVMAVNRSTRLLRRHTQAKDRIESNLGTARSNLCVAVHLLDPTTLDFLRDELDPTLEACREAVRERRWRGGGSPVPA